MHIMNVGLLKSQEVPNVPFYLLDSAAFENNEWKLDYTETFFNIQAINNTSMTTLNINLYIEGEAYVLIEVLKELALMNNVNVILFHKSSTGDYYTQKWQ